MLGVLLGIGVLLFLAYATYVLFFNLDEEEGTSLEDFIVDRPGTLKTRHVKLIHLQSPDDM